MPRCHVQRHCSRLGSVWFVKAAPLRHQADQASARANAFGPADSAAASYSADRANIFCAGLSAALPIAAAGVHSLACGT